MFEIHASLDVNLDPNDILARFGLEEHGRVQKAIDNACIKYMYPYWAHDEGTLADSAWSATDIGSGIITYPGPYAHYMYYGEVYGPNFIHEMDSNGHVIQWRSPSGKGSKHDMGRQFGDLKDIYPDLQGYKKDYSALSGSFPFERMKADHLEDILEEARRVARDK